MRGAQAPRLPSLMKLAPAQLGKHLQGALAPVYIISGDDPLLCQEAADAIRTAARQQGFDERQVFAADASFDWGTLLQAGASMSLFAEKRLLELRLPSGKPGDKGAAAFIETLLACSGADGVGGFLAQQRVITADDVDRRKATLQVFGELGGGEFHRQVERGARYSLRKRR